MSAQTPIPSAFLDAMPDIYRNHYARIVAEAEAEQCRRESHAWGGPPVTPLEWGAPVSGPTSILSRVRGDYAYPVRANAPKAGDACYEPGETPGRIVTRPRVAGWITLGILGAALTVLVALIWIGVR